MPHALFRLLFQHTHKPPATTLKTIDSIIWTAKTIIIFECSLYRTLQDKSKVPLLAGFFANKYYKLLHFQYIILFLKKMIRIYLTNHF
ncbi:MAG: hypothetical protein AMK69_08630 [Nitrospira bacterium SG8_3]|nr:MAG: hypothetical protein AMK69_08630 [Nitrospira bacterium SG8_3]